MKPYYVVLTGSKNNAGDFLIKHRAKQLFASLRSDRDVVDFDGWLPLAGDNLETVNGARALILMGGPALQERMYPDIYPLTASLDDIRVPIIAMGIGWKSARGDWRDTYDYPLSEPTLALLRRIADSGHLSGVRDFHTLNVLANRGFDGFLMTGCPAYYDLDAIGRSSPPPVEIGRVAFSLGVSFVRSKAMEAQMQEQILALRDRFRDCQFEVAFHHSLEPATFLGVYPKSARHIERHLAFAAWLDRQGVPRADISGSAERMLDYYRGVDLHVGYRVHAHILMTSRSALSVLLAEDGRGKATREVAGSLVVDAFDHIRTGARAALSQQSLPLIDRYVANPRATREVLELIRYEQLSGGQRTAAARQLVDNSFRVMREFFAQLP